MRNKVMCVLYNYEILMSSFKGIRHPIVTVIGHIDFNHDIKATINWLLTVNGAENGNLIFT